MDQCFLIIDIVLNCCANDKKWSKLKNVNRPFHYEAHSSSGAKLAEVREKGSVNEVVISQ